MTATRSSGSLEEHGSRDDEAALFPLTIMAMNGWFLKGAFNDGQHPDQGAHAAKPRKARSLERDAVLAAIDGRLANVHGTVARLL